MPTSHQQNPESRPAAKTGQHAEPRPASRAGQAIIIMSGMISACVLTLALYFFQGIFRPFFVAIFLCFLVKPWTLKFGRRAGVFGYAFAIAVIFGVFSIGDRVISNDLRELGPKSKEYQKNLDAYREGIEGFLRRHKNIVELVIPNAEKGDLRDHDRPDSQPQPTSQPTSQTTSSDPTQPPEDKAAQLALDMILPVHRIEDILNPQFLKSVLGSSASFFFGFFGEAMLILVCVLLILLETDRLPSRLRRVYGDEQAEKILAVFSDVNKSVQRYVSLKVLISFITAFVSVLIMKSFELDFAVTFGIVIFLFNFVPYIGSVVATLLPCMVALLKYDEPLTALWLALALAGAQQIIGNIIEPRVQGKGLSISPVVIILALGFWGWLWGISGMILAVPITVTIRIILEQFETTRRPAMMMGSDG